MSQASYKMPGSKPKIGLSACLAGFEVRYDGKHKRSSLCLDELSKHFSFETFCPEAAAGFGIPRPKMRLTGNPSRPTLRYNDDTDLTGINLGPQLLEGCKEALDSFGSLDGFVLMKNSPSCGVRNVKIFQSDSTIHQQGGMGLFAAALKERFPLLPIEEEVNLHDESQYMEFVKRVHAHFKSRK
ncbi:hypothetical protein A3752_14590 [Oleiphilus sp. HI0081]|jgi:uncharacterized protein YbbK (DUF523 family)|uniref:DUF523 domain-containing protein n=4 Tax=Oleiphilus TaxID=141450 RepID=UPI0007C2B20C|nr:MULTISPECIES: DUF523 domain-containing protein [unclassified Oleiphilus]KZY45732.1 hypothetical protein A3732_09565 [Oleiphilus sp. HI0050]KZY73173.1 hypothetical protein A3740_19685 [Oleiphilus sp. HI0068]KZY76976.1 hypothetical protein A3741_10155 [Oleiphilus sp. HI0069]KZZ19426.1 hypothetical protein A3752_14590 [Oleiphilus sp. HI0081]KZZ31634.1 hypothetical protein A3756_06715 [Oleiphilus sp. HI0086]KZZ47375.1 hypothetical protein A3755_15865 [Oleiphilus sp. HI0085]KZZ52284.1 hypothet